jgi:hypothetical protein
VGYIEKSNGGMRCDIDSGFDVRVNVLNGCVLAKYEARVGSEYKLEERSEQSSVFARIDILIPKLQAELIPRPGRQRAERTITVPS